MEHMYVNCSDSFLCSDTVQGPKPGIWWCPLLGWVFSFQLMKIPYRHASRPNWPRYSFNETFFAGDSRLRWADNQTNLDSTPSALKACKIPDLLWQTDPPHTPEISCGFALPAWGRGGKGCHRKDTALTGSEEGIPAGRLGQQHRPTVLRWQSKPP